MNNYLKGKRLYLSGAIEMASGQPNWRTEPKKVFTNKFGIDVFDPFDDPQQQWMPFVTEARKQKDYAYLKRMAKGAVRKDLQELQHSHFLIARLSPKIPTCGTYHEIINSNNSKNPTLIVCEEGKENISFWLYGFIPLEFMFSSFEELYAYLDEVDQGLHKDNNRWSYVYGMV